MSAAKTHFQKLLEKQWEFLEEEWPIVDAPNNHRSAVKQVGNIKHVKDVLMSRLGAIPVFFFLVVLWPLGTYPGPYREVEKGLLVLYHLAKGLAMDGMSPCIPKSSFHAIHAAFYKKYHGIVSKRVSYCLANMFSTIYIRLICAKEKNPALFNHVTLHLDGHDTRATYDGQDSAEMYSYKLKKSGLRTQVCIDSNGMALWVSKSQSCKNYNDGVMLQDMKVHEKFHNLDCVALDGGYNQYIGKLLEDTDLAKRNFCCPIRKKRNKDLTTEEANYNKIFGSFRSAMESLFGELGRTFEKHNNRQPVIVDKRQTYNLQLRLCLLLLNTKKMVALLGLEPQPIHYSWMTDGFDYPLNNSTIEQIMEYTPVAEMLEEANDMAKLQDQFLHMTTMEMDEPLSETRKHILVTAVEIPSMKKR